MIKSKKEAMKDVGKVLRRKIIIQKMEVVQDDIGNQKMEWVDWRPVWAERNNLWGQEYYAAKAVNEESTIVFTVRYAPFIDEMNTVDYRIKHNGKFYEIKQIDYLQYDDLWVKIKALERGADGQYKN
ncbi:MAG TPA: phage head closure protein [Thermoanaerobacterales bacterium]|nr:phage head closure protein [Thermoanaerobacterales bacterium]